MNQHLTPMTAGRFVVIYKPAKGSPTEYYGPFVSERLADEFVVEKLPVDSLTWVRPLMSRQDI